MNKSDLPIPDIVAEHSGHCIDDDSLVASIRQVLLERAIGTIRVADEHPETTVEELIKLPPNALVEASNPARSTEEYCVHGQPRARVSANAKTAETPPASFRRRAIALRVAPD